MEPKNLSENDNLIYFLIDDGELGGGMYIAAAYQNFIKWQNDFLQPLIESETQNRNLNYYIENLKNKIPVQEVTNECLLIDNYTKSDYNDFEEIMYSFSRRNIFNKDGTINYLKYNSFIFDFSTIEEELGEIILPGKCIFENEDKLNFVAFWGEGFRGGKSDTLIKFYEKYPQEDLNKDEKNIIVKYILEITSGESVEKYDFTQFFTSLNLLIFYLLNNTFKPDKKISEVIKDIPPYLKLSKDCKNLFNDKVKEFPINKLMNIFFYIEHLCFKDLCKNLHSEYKKEISSDLINKIKKELLENKNEENEEYSIKDLASALRRFISRYLSGQREDVEIDEKRELFHELTRIDLWEEKIGKLDNLEDLIKNQLEKFKLTVGQSFKFYEIIGEKDKLEIKEDIATLITINPETNSKNIDEKIQTDTSSSEDEEDSNEIEGDEKRQKGHKKI